LLRFDKAVAGLIMVVFIVLTVELTSSRLRARLRPGEHEGKGFVESLRDLANPGKWLGVNTGGRD
jgi:phosphonate transport system permease protein